jgi:hypothetical protein
MDPKDLALRKIKSQWKKDKALLEQKNQLLQLDVMDLKDRALNLKRSNAALIQSIDCVKTNQYIGSVGKMIKLEEENKKLKMKLTEASREKEKLEHKKKKLKVDTANYREKYLICSKEKKIKEQKYSNQMKKLELEFERLRRSNDQLLDAFKNVLQQGDKAERCCEHYTSDRSASMLRRSMDSSTVNICSRCAGCNQESKGSLRGSDDFMQGSMGSSQVIILKTEVSPPRAPLYVTSPQLSSGAFNVKHSIKTGVGKCLIKASKRNSTVEVKDLSIAEVDQTSDVLQETYYQPSEHSRPPGIPPIKKSSTSNLQYSKYMDSTSRVQTEVDNAVSARSFRHRRKSGSNLQLLGTFNSRAAASKCSSKEDRYHIAYKVTEKSSPKNQKPTVRESLQSLASKGTEVSVQNSRIEETVPTGSTTLRKDYSSKPDIPPLKTKPSKERLETDNVLDCINIVVEESTGQGASTSKQLINNSIGGARLSICPSFQGSERKTDRSWVEDKENIEKRLNRQPLFSSVEPQGSTSARKTAGSGIFHNGTTVLNQSNVFRSSVARESVQDCLSFNDMLREKLANIENKLNTKG